MTTMPDSIALALPPGWDDVPMELGRYRRRLARQIAQMRSNGLKRADARLIEVQGALLHRLMAQQNVIIASNYLALETPNAADADTEAGTAEGDEAVSTLVMAGVCVSTITRSSLDTDVPLAPEVLLSVFGQHAPADDQEVRYAEIEPPSKCLLGDVDAVRLVRLVNARNRSGSESKLFSQTYLVPVANGDALVVLQFSTINFDYAAQFARLFDRIAGTLRVLYPEAPTFLDDPELVTEQMTSVDEARGPDTT